MATIVGTSGNDNLSGTTVADNIYGLAGNDTMAGGLGNDVYYVDSTYDVVTEGVDAGTDSVYASSYGYTLGANVENLYLQGSAYYGYGNALNNSIVGNNSNNYLNGGAGRDWMAGGLGSDSYVVDNTSDVISEGVGVGTDSVYAYDSYILGANIENLYLYGSAYSGFGNGLNNSIVGNAGNNYLWGGAGNDIINGGADRDTMVGGNGNDIYYVDSTWDVITEGVDAGTDSVYASSYVSSSEYTLSANIENLYLSEGATAGKGNELNNYIEGNAGHNVIDGGAGNDRMAGGLGSDIYYVDSTSDVVIEGVDAGTDGVAAYASYTLSANVEGLTLYGSAYYGYGNALNNSIRGNAGNNDLRGGAGNDTITGGDGSDVLTGGTGADYFGYYGSGMSHTVTVTDFSRAEGDKIELSTSGFYNSLITASGVIPGTENTDGPLVFLNPPGSLHSSQFVTGAGATTSSHRIIYNSSTGALSFDRDGIETTYSAVQFATLSTGLALISSDFRVTW